MINANITKDYKFQFQNEFTLEQRRAIYKKNAYKYPDCFLVILEKDPAFAIEGV